MRGARDSKTLNPVTQILRSTFVILACGLLISQFTFAADNAPLPLPPEHPGIEIGALEGHRDEINCVAISSTGLIASGSNDKTARIWDQATGRQVFILSVGDNVGELAFSGDGKILATGGPDRLVRLWDTATGKLIKSLEGMRNPIFKLGWSHDGSILAAAGGDDGKVFNVQTGMTISTFEGKFALSPDGHTLATSLADGGIQLTDAVTGIDGLRLQGHRGYANELQFSPDGKTLASGGADQRGIFGDRNDPHQDKLVKLWDVQTGKNLATLAGHWNGIGHLMFAPDGKSLVSTDYNGCMFLWDLSTNKPVSMLGNVTYPNVSCRSPLGHWALAPDLKTWAVATENKILVFDIRRFTGK